MQGLRHGANQIESGIAVIERTALTIPEPEQRAQMYADTQEMRQEAADLRREADALETGG